MTNPRSDIDDRQDLQPSGSKTTKFLGVHASNNENSDSENDDFPLRASRTKNLKQPAKPRFRSESDVNVTIHSDEESDEEEVEDYHMVTGANRQLHRKSSQNPNDTIGSHVDQNLSNSTTRPLNPVNWLTKTHNHHFSTRKTH